MPKAVRDERSQSEKDCDRILYSSAFRRLAGVTQVVSVSETALFHNRLTHTMKVAQLAERLAQDLLRGKHADEEALDVGSAKAAALAHDLGHPPFGHVAEDVLRDLCTQAGIGGFEGNAQSFRILTKLSRRGSPEPGLGLSQRSLNGVLKYPWLRPPTEDPPERATDEQRRIHRYRRKKWGAYKSEEDAFLEARGGDQTEKRSIEAAIMEWADDVSYALHDIEDFFRAGLLPLERLPDERDWFISNAAIDLRDDPEFNTDLFSSAFRGLIGLLPRKPYDGSDQDRQTLHRQTNELIDSYFSAVRVSRDGKLIIDASVRNEIMMLKQLTWQYVVNSPALATVQRGQMQVIDALFRCLVDWQLDEPHPHRLPTRLHRIRELVERDASMGMQPDSVEAIAARTAADYISQLTEDQATDLYRRFRGLSTTSVLEGWVRW